MTTETEKKPAFTKPEPQEEHKWLNKLVGKWTVEFDCHMGPEGKPTKSKGTETVRNLGDYWIVSEGEMEGFDGKPHHSIMTLGYDPSKKHYVGTWTGTMMTNMWVYEGDLDSAKKVLPLNTVGPDFHGGDLTKEAKYQDIIEIVSDDHRILRSQVQGADGKWTQMMEAHYKRVK